MDFENKAINVVLDDWDDIMEKANNNEEFTNQEVISLLWAKVILKRMKKE